MRRSIRGLALVAMPLTLATTAGGRTYDKAGSGGERSGTIGLPMPTKSAERWIGDGDKMATQFQAPGYSTDNKRKVGP